jgi:hypothetical protein
VQIARRRTQMYCGQGNRRWMLRAQEVERFQCRRDSVRANSVLQR